MSLSAQYVRYASVEQPIVLFYGVGPGISYAREETENGQPHARDRGVGCAGGEWFMGPDLGLSAGYRLLLEYQWMTEEDGTAQKLTSGREEEPRGFEQTTTPFLLRSQGARLGVSLYF